MVITNVLHQFATRCLPGSGFELNFPTWYKYLDCGPYGVPKVEQLTDVWKIGAAILEMLIYVAGVTTVFFLIFGGIKYITSQGQPERLNLAKNTLFYAAVGLILAIAASAIVQFIFSRMGATPPAAS